MVVRRVRWIWGLLFFNVLSFTEDVALVVHIPHRVGQVLTQGALPLAFVLALTVNPKVKIRLNAFLGLYSALAVMSLAMGVRLVGLGTTYRSLRLVVFVAVLWLLTPWWGRRDLLLVRTQMRILLIVLGSVAIGFLLSPRKALAVNFGARRLTGVIWPIPPTQLAHHVAELCGLTLLMWMCRLLSRRQALLVLVPSVAALLATHTRTALVALIAGVLVGSLSLLRVERRVRKTLTTASVVVLALVLPLAPLVSAWIDRGQTSTQLSDLSGRTTVWPLVLSEHRPETAKIFGSGLSNGSVENQPVPSANGLPIDSSWIATYQDQGIVGDFLEGLMFLTLLLLALLRARGPGRALALFLVVFCLFSSFTETGVGQASIYLMDLVLAASLVVPKGAATAAGAKEEPALA